MKISGGNTTATNHAQTNRVKDAAAVGVSAVDITASQSTDGGAMQSAALQPALSALRELPDFDQAKVDALRDALAKGEVVFDAARLAGLIQRFHGKER